MFVRTARWLGDKLQRWAEGGARRFERAGERARHFAEEGGERAQGFTDREQRRVAHWSERAGRGIQRAGQEVEHLGSRSPYGYEQRMAGGPGGTMRSRHVGRGPKAYRRSDERIREEACEELTWADIDASDIDVSVESGEVTLSGAVPRREWKRLAEDLIAVISGVQDVQNNLRVRSPEAETSSTSPESSFPGTLGEATHH